VSTQQIPAEQVTTEHKIPSSKGEPCIILEARITEPVDPDSEWGRIMTPEERAPHVYIRYTAPRSHVFHNIVLRLHEPVTVIA
jgi:hypothetical protein